MTESQPRERLACGVARAVEATRDMGRVMLSVSHGGATHERIGPVDQVSADGHAVTMAGAHHDARIDLAVVAGVIADRTGRMGERAMPRLEFEDAGGSVLFSIIALEGLEPFDHALQGVGAGEALPARERPAPPEGRSPPAEVDPQDVGARPLHAAREAGATLSVIFRGNGLEQRWQGQVAEVRPAMGFINIIQPDFHLHLKAGAVASWRTEGSGDTLSLHAEDAGGQPLGLVLAGAPATA